MDVLDAVEETERAVLDKDWEKAKAHIDNGKKILLNRCKLIKLADRESWFTVKEYLKDDLASDSDDERKINKAIKSADTKSDKYFSRKRTHFRQAADFRKRSRPIICYTCGKMGHIAAKCFKNQKRDTPFRK